MMYVEHSHTGKFPRAKLWNNEPLFLHMSVEELKRERMKWRFAAGDKASDRKTRTMAKYYIEYLSEWIDMREEQRETTAYSRHLWFPKGEREE